MKFDIDAEAVLLGVQGWYLEGLRMLVLKAANHLEMGNRVDAVRLCSLLPKSGRNLFDLRNLDEVAGSKIYFDVVGLELRVLGNSSLE